MPLTSFSIQNARPRAKPYMLADGGGLHLLVNINGSKWWRLRYRFAGKQLMLSLGTFPEITLATARERRDEARKLVAQGVNPSEQRKAEKVTAAISAQNTFGAIGAEYIQRLEDLKRSRATVSKNRWLIEELATPLAHRPITEITPAEILDLLRKFEKAGLRETARRLRGTIGSVFRFAIQTLRATNDPTYALRGALLPPEVQHRAAITDEMKLGTLMCAIDTYDGWPTIRASLLFLALTMTRPGDVRHMKRSEVVWPKALWRIPAERMKMRRPHDVPLSTQALAVLRDVWSLSEDRELVFPSIRSLERPLSENAMNSALRRMGFSGEEHCAHGFRSSASTICNDRRLAEADVIEAALAHQDEDDVRRAYNRTTYLPERVKLMQEWADLLDEFRKQSATRAA